MKVFSLKNNSSTVVRDDVVPWLLDKPLPAFSSKEEFRAWGTHPTTDHCFFSMIEGEVPGLRLGNGNKPSRVHGLVADYDCPGLTEDEIAKGIARCPRHYLPAAWNQTFSGGVRVVWAFEEPVFFYNHTTYKRFIKRLKKELRLTNLFPNLDDRIETPEMYYCGGDGWSVTPNHSPIRASALHLWLAEASKDDDFDGGIEIPIEVVAAEVTKRYPGRWEGPFVLGARGVRFWEDGADALSAIVRATGMQAFTGNEGFLSWQRLFGREFVQQYLQNKLGAAVRDIFFDGVRFWWQLPDERWADYGCDSLTLRLQVKYGLSGSARKGEETSEASLARAQIEETKRVVGCLPFPHNPNRIVRMSGFDYLNVSNARLWPAALDSVDWAEDFPWIANFLTAFFAEEKELKVFLAWLQIWIKSLHEGHPRKGHALFLVGPPGTGKTLLTHRILGPLVGGAVEATSFIVDNGRFTDELFNKVLWTIDDALAGTDNKLHDRFSNAVKALTANTTFRYEKKFGRATDVSFNGRLCVTLNEDPTSLSMLPNSDMSLLDKVIILQTGDLPADVATNEQERYATIERELGSFVRWLLDWEIPADVERENRFGIKAYSSPELVEEARATTVSFEIEELLDVWRQGWAGTNPESSEWTGTVTELYGLLCASERTAPVARRYQPRWLGRYLTQAIDGGCAWISKHRTESQRTITIKLK